MTTTAANAKSLAPIWALLLAAAVGCVRLLANVVGAFNSSPVAASATYGGARLRLWQALLVPMGIMVSTDLVLWAAKSWDARYSPWDLTRVWVYGSFLVNVLLGMYIIRKNRWWQIGAAGLLGSAMFFLITNFGCWLDPRFGYAAGLDGLIACYIAGVPFWRATLVSDMLFTFGLFGIEALALHLSVIRQNIPNPAGAQS